MPPKSCGSWSKGIAALAKTVTDSIGKPDSADALKNALGMLGGKPIDYSDKVIDNTFGKGLRQIVYYCFVDNVGFIYYRFNFKMSSKGWILAKLQLQDRDQRTVSEGFRRPIGCPAGGHRHFPLARHGAIVARRLICYSAGIAAR